MGLYKTQRIIEEEKYQFVIKLAVEKGVLIRCIIHGQIYNSNVDSTEPLYKYANYLYNINSPLVEIFDDRNDLTNTIKNVLETVWYSCIICEKEETKN